MKWLRARSEYKSTIRKCKFKYDLEKTKKLENARFKNAKMYWNMLKESAGIKCTNISIDNFAAYF